MAEEKTSTFLDIKIALMRVGLTQTDIGKLLGRSRAYINSVLRGKFKSPEVSAKIKEITGIDL